MNKLLSVLTATALVTTSLNAEADFYLGYEGANQTYGTSTNRNVFQEGLGFGGRLYSEVSDGLYLGGEAGLSHIETHPDISGNMGHIQFVMKYRLGNYVELFGGVGGGVRGTPADLNSSVNNDNIIFAGMYNIGIAYVSTAGWRGEVAYSHYGFEGDIDGNAKETIATDTVGVRFGKTFDLSN